jgi:phosphoribosyl-ATP pyrophosphohydrolase
MNDILERLFATIESRRSSDPKTSYTAQLLASGTPAIIAKITEESGETVRAALNEGKARVVAESADLLYHLLVLWADQKVTPDEVWAELERREGTSGIEEKRRR